MRLFVPCTLVAEGCLLRVRCSRRTSDWGRANGGTISGGRGKPERPSFGLANILRIFARQPIRPHLQWREKGSGCFGASEATCDRAPIARPEQHPRALLKRYGQVKKNLASARNHDWRPGHQLFQGARPRSERLKISLCRARFHRLPKRGEEGRSSPSVGDRR